MNKQRREKESAVASRNDRGNLDMVLRQDDFTEQAQAALGASQQLVMTDAPFAVGRRARFTWLA